MILLVIEAFHVETLLANLRKKLSLKETLNIRGKGWDIAAIFIAVTFLFSWLPYVFIGRATYIYHYYLSVPLLCLAITYFINKYWQKPLGKVFAIAVFATTVALFVLFYPAFSGAPASSDYVNSLEWVARWKFRP